MRAAMNLLCVYSQNVTPRSGAKVASLTRFRGVRGGGGGTAPLPLPLWGSPDFPRSPGTLRKTMCDRGLHFDCTLDANANVQIWMGQ